MSLSTIDLLAYARQGLLATLEGLTTEQINRVPAGFKNNLAWQLGHVIVVEQVYGYRKAGLPINIDEKMVEEYGNGTVPTRDLSQDEIDALKKMAMTTLQHLRTHKDDGVFNTYEPFTITAQNFPIASIDDGLQFLLLHEGLHLGAARNLKNAVAA